MNTKTIIVPLLSGVLLTSALAAPPIKTAPKPAAPTTSATKPAKAKPSAAVKPATGKAVTAKPAKPKTKPGGLPIPAPSLSPLFNGIRETKLPNGLTVLTKEVRAAPVVYFSVWYKVGSVNEQVGQTGMSHLMEHMLFKGTKTRGPGVISATLQNNGANFNATTSFDRTVYFETLASDRLELGMQIESDRMVNSLFDEKQHQKEMTVVRSEYEAGENNPGNALSKAVRLSAFQVHPYRWQTIGFRSDIENFSRDEMVAYYKNYYVPNNATIVIVGDFKTADALAMVRKYFGHMPRKAVKQHYITPEPPQEGERRVTVRRSGTTPAVQIAYHIPGALHPDRYALDVLETVLSSGRSSRFFTSMIQSGLASSADAYDYGLRDPDLLFLDADAQPGRTNAELEAALLKEVDRLQQAPITPEELQRSVNLAEAYLVYGRDSVEQQGRLLGEFAMRGNWRYGETYMANMRKVTAADVQRVAKKYLVARNRTVGYFEPITDRSGSGQGASEAAGTPQIDRTADATTDLSKIPLLKSKVDVASGPKPVRFVLPNGLTVIVRENHANPTVALSGALLSAGGVFDPAGKPGLADFTADLLSRGTKSRTLLDMARILEGKGISLSIGDGDEYVAIKGRALVRDLNSMLTILADQLRRPSFPAAEVEKARAQSLAQIESSRDDTSVLSSIAFSRALFPAGHPYRQPTLDEAAAALKGITRADVNAFHANHYAPDKMILSIVGAVKAVEVKALIQKHFGDWARNGNLPALTVPNVPQPAPKTIIIPVADKAQADVIYGFPGGLKRSDPDFYRVIVLNTILGGGTGLSSRLATNVRDRQGLVYGIYSDIEATLGAGAFSVQFGANPANIDRAVNEARRQIAAVRDKGITPLEVEQAVSYMTGSYPVTLSTNSVMAQQLMGAQIYGLGLDYIAKRNSYYRSVTAAEVNAAAKKYLKPQGILVIAGSYKRKP